MIAAGPSNTQEEEMRMRMKRGILYGLLLLATTGFFMPKAAAQGAPLRINFQGRLTDSSNQPITALTTVVISLYRGGTAQDAAGTLLYRESVAIQPDSLGHFNHLIGAGTPLDGTSLDAVDFATVEPVYLEISINGTAQLPRQPVVSVPYAIQAATLGGLTAADFVPATGGQISAERMRLINANPSDGLQVTMSNATNASSAATLVNLSSNAASKALAITSAGGKGITVSVQANNALQAASNGTTAEASTIDAANNSATTGTALRARLTSAANTGTALLVENPSSNTSALGAQMTTSAGTALQLQAGAGSAIKATNSGTASPTVAIAHAGAGDQPALVAQLTADNTATAARFVNASTKGTPTAITAELTGANNNGTAARFLNLSANTAGRALYVESGAGDGMELRSSAGNNAAELKNNSNSEVMSTLLLQNTGTGDLLRAYSGGTFDQLSAGKLRFRVTGSGNVTADGTITGGGADFAEMLEVSGSMKAYEAGDVLVISPEGDLRIEKSGSPYASAVVGIYSTRPGVLGDHPMIRNSGAKIPVALVGIVPCKVTTENGPIRPGDLLVTSSLPGHAMRGTDPSRMQGAVLGKALQPLATGTGTVQVLVSLQ